MAIDYKKFGAVVKNSRKKMGYSQKEVYALTGISTETQRLLENGYREPRVITLERLSEVYKVDLIFALANSRTENDLFSSEFIEKIADDFNNLEYDQFIEDIEALISTIREQYLNDGHKTKENMKFIESLESFKSLNLYEYRYNMTNSLFYEQLLQFFAKGKANILVDSSLYYIELQIGILLAISYRINNQFERSKIVLERIIASLEKVPNLTNRQNDYLIVAHFNMCYLLHRLDEHAQIIDYVNRIFRTSRLRFKRTYISDLLVRKAVAQYMLGNPNYQHTFAMALSVESSARAKSIYDRALEIYGIDITEFMDMSDVAGFEGDQIKTE